MSSNTAVNEITTDIAIVGSGGAGLMCALHAHEANPDLDITVISKGAVGRSGCTRMVQGGYNAVLNANDSIDAHFADTLQGGKYLNNQDLAWTLVNDAPKVIHELETRVGCFFDRNPDGTIHQKPFAGQTFDRTVHRGDLTGIEIMSRLRDQMFRIGATELEDIRALDILLGSDGSCAGLICLDIRTGEFVIVRAPVVVMATGGAATMFKVAAPAREKTGDGVGMLLRAGLLMRDMEMMQFHPTGLLAGDSRMTGAVLEEGLRGAGAYLLNTDGERYMSRYDAENMERSTRDIVSRGSYLEIMAGRGTPEGGVLLDISHLGKEEVERRFPGMVARTRLIGSDLATRPVQVSPTAHFHMGGAVIDADCNTAIEGLLVAGEDAGGVHGANRLGGNGVAESTVYGARSGDTAAKLLTSRTSPPSFDSDVVSAAIDRAMAPMRRSSGPDPFVITRRLKEGMWSGCGVVRDREGLERTAGLLNELQATLDSVSVPDVRAFNPAWQEALDLANQLVVARAVVTGAQLREETRGAHARADFPERRDDTWLKFLTMRLNDEGTFDINETPVEFNRSDPPEAAVAHDR